MEKLYIDDDCVTSFFIGSLYYFIQKWQGYLRYLKFEKYQDKKFVLMTNIKFHCLVSDFSYLTLDLPVEFYKMGFQGKGYEAVLDQREELTSPHIYSQLIRYFRNYYNRDKAIEIWTPRNSDTFWIDKKPQIFTQYVSNLIEHDKPIISIFPGNDINGFNIPPVIWQRVIDILSQHYILVVSSLDTNLSLRLDNENIVNLVSYNEDDKLEQIIGYLNNSICSVGMNNGLAHVGIFTRCPTYLIGNFDERENHSETITASRKLSDYRAIDEKTILDDVELFIRKLMELEESTIRKVGRLPLGILYNHIRIEGLLITDDLMLIDNVLENLDISKLYLKSKYKMEDERVINIKSLKEVKAGLNFAYMDSVKNLNKNIKDSWNLVKEYGILAGSNFDNYDVKIALQKALSGKEVNYGKIEGQSYEWWIQKDDNIFGNG